jgi:hypothetical protein|tara:strand:- start:59 stop:952 length:894 start_codon:yes stop_codon:yes gene_type:complete
MRYQEAYEMIEAGLSKAALGFPITEPLIASFFDNKVQEVGARVLRKRNSQTFSTSTTNVYTLSNEDASMRIYKVAMIGSNDSKTVPYVSEKRYAEGIDEDTIQNIGYFVSEESASTGSITGATSANPIVVTSSAHGLETGDRVKITDIVGLLSATGAKSEVNDVVHSITVTSAGAFSIPVKGAAYGTAYDSVGTWTLGGIKLTLTKTPDSGSTLKVYYYATPMPKNAVTDGVDLPAQLIPACVHYALAHFLLLDSQMQIGSGHYGIAEKIEKEFIETRNSREAKPDIIPPPLQDFIF